MFDEILDLFDRDRRHGTQRRGGLRGLLARVTGSTSTDEDRHADERRRASTGSGSGDDRRDPRWLDDEDDDSEHDGRRARHHRGRDRDGDRDWDD